MYLKILYETKIRLEKQMLTCEMYIKNSKTPKQMPFFSQKLFGKHYCFLYRNYEIASLASAMMYM